MKKRFFFILLALAISVVSLVSCDKDGDKTEGTLILKSDIIDGGKVYVGQTVVLTTEYNGEDVTSDLDVKYFVNGKGIPTHKFEATEVGKLTVSASYKGVTSNELSIDIENAPKDQRELLLSYVTDRQGTIQVGDEIIFHAILKESDSEKNVSSDTEVKYFVNDNEIEGSKFKTTEAGKLVVIAHYQDIKSNTLSISVEKSVESELMLSHDKQGDKIYVGDEINFTIVLKDRDSETDVTSQSKIYIDDALIDGTKYNAVKAGLFSVEAEYGDKRTVRHQFIVIEREPEITGLKVIRTYMSGRNPLTTDFSKLKVSVYGYNDTQKEINVYTYEINGESIECTRWDIDFVSDEAGRQVVISLLVPVNGDTVLNPLQNDRIYVYSLNISLPGENNEHESMSLSILDEADAKYLSGMDISFTHFSLGEKKNDYMSGLSLKFLASIKAVITDNFIPANLDVEIRFICNEEVDNTSNILRIQNDIFDVDRTIAISGFDDLF